MKDAGNTMASIVKDVPGGPRFMMPAELCEAMWSSRRNGRAMRVMVAMIWLGAQYLRRGQRGKVFVSLSDLRFAAGLESHRSNRILKEILSDCGQEQLTLTDGSEVRLFDMVTIETLEGMEHAIWVFSEPVVSLFTGPQRYAPLDIINARKMTSGIDMMMYLRIGLAWNKKDRRSVIPSAVARDLTGLGEDAAFKRVVERMKRAAARLGERLGVDIAAETERRRGARQIGVVHLRILT